MKISLAPQQYFDLDGKPLVSGRLKIHLHGSDTLADTFLLTGNDFVQGPNPVVLDNAGEQQNTIFMEAAIYDIEVEKYDNGQYVKISDFQFGFNMPTSKNDTVVQNMTGLAEADTSLEFVTVVGYDGTTYAGPRMYMWDSQCTEEEDGGCIVASTVDDHGRWLLLSDLRELPCTYYGVEAGRESNMSAFLTYLPVVGTHGIFMPPVPRFLTGTYTSEGTLSCTKTISFDQGAKFTKATFGCISAEISEPVNDYVADFQFLHQAYAESSWFRTAKAFWACGAAELHQSRTNHFESNNLGSTFTGVANCKISGRPMTLSGTGGLLITHCDIDDRALSTDWYITFQDMVLTDRWFNDANYNIGMNPHYRQYANTTSNVLDLANFQNANVYVLWAAAWGLTAIDLYNRPVGTITADMPFTSITNATIAEAHFDNSIALNNVICLNLNFEHQNISVTTRNCTCILTSVNCKDWNDNGSSFSMNCDINSYYVQLNWLNTSLNMNGHRISVGEAQNSSLYHTKQLVMWRCTVSDGVIGSDNPIFLECNIANTTIYVYPCSIFEGNQMSWTMTMEFRKNRFNGSSCIHIGAHNGLSDHLEEVYECAMTGLAITDNVFNTTVFGITCPFWSGPSLAYRFFRGLTTFVTGQSVSASMMSDPSLFPIPFTYRNNDGNCPRAFGWPNPCQHTLSIDPIGMCSPWMDPSSASGGALHIYDMPQQSVFCMPAIINETRGPVPEAFVSNSVIHVDPLCAMTPYRAKATMMMPGGGSVGSEGMCCDFPFHAYIPRCALDRSMPNDAFDCIVSTWGIYGQYCGVNPMPAID